MLVPNAVSMIAVQVYRFFDCLSFSYLNSFQPFRGNKKERDMFYKQKSYGLFFSEPYRSFI